MLHAQLSMTGYLINLTNLCLKIKFKKNLTRYPKVCHRLLLIFLIWKYDFNYKYARTNKQPRKITTFHNNSEGIQSGIQPKNKDSAPFFHILLAFRLQSHFNTITSSNSTCQRFVLYHTERVEGTLINTLKKMLKYS